MKDNDAKVTYPIVNYFDSVKVGDEEGLVSELPRSHNTLQEDEVMVFFGKNDERVVKVEAIRPKYGGKAKRQFQLINQIAGRLDHLCYLGDPDLLNLMEEATNLNQLNALFQFSAHRKPANRPLIAPNGWRWNPLLQILSWIADDGSYIIEAHQNGNTTLRTLGKKGITSSVYVNKNGDARISCVQPTELSQDDIELYRRIGFNEIAEELEQYKDEAIES